MLLCAQPVILVVSRDPALLEAMEPLLASTGMRVRVVIAPSEALGELQSSEIPCLVLFDIDACTAEENSFCHWLGEARATLHGHRYPIVLIADSVNDDWLACLTEGALDDLIPRSVDQHSWRLRFTLVLRTFHRMRELDRLRESSVMEAQLDRLTGVCNRATLLSVLFRETDRVQRMKTQLSVILFDVDGFGLLNTQIGPAACDDVLCQITGRTMRLLRSYDVLGRTGADEFLLVLPGCGTADALMLSERLRIDVFGMPFPVGGQMLHLTACFGIAPSQGRSPIVVLRAAEEALADAKRAGCESIVCAGSAETAVPTTANFLSDQSGEETLAW